jgi:hypothetical protein
MERKLTIKRAGYLRLSLHNHSSQLTSRLTGLLIIIIIVVVLRPFEQRRVPHPGSTGGTSLQKTGAHYYSNTFTLQSNI